jgi:hypothetical protein
MASMLKSKKGSTLSQSARFLEAAKRIGADETGKKFEKALKKIAKTKKLPKGSP